MLCWAEAGLCCGGKSSEVIVDGQHLIGPVGGFEAFKGGHHRLDFF